MQIAIMDYQTGSISLHTLPQWVDVNKPQDIEDYIHLTLEVNNECEYMYAENIIITDFRNK